MSHIEMIPTDAYSLRLGLINLVSEFGLAGLKSGTEAEGMSFSEIRFLREISAGIVPLHTKIGGPEARNDIRELMHIGVDGLIAPMVESAFAVKKFIQAVTDECDRLPDLALNLETRQALLNLDEILESPYLHWVSRITAARTDLSESFDLYPDHPEITRYCRKIISKVKKLNKETSVGGSIQDSSIEIIRNRVRPDFINTRLLLFYADALNPQALNEGLIWEQQFHTYLADCDDFEISSRKFHEKRAVTLSKRMQISATA
jgi:hypothetical protein